jgi:hypothetical protein
MAQKRNDYKATFRKVTLQPGCGAGASQPSSVLDEGRQENDGKDDAAPQSFVPRSPLCRAKLAVEGAELNQGSRARRCGSPRVGSAQYR